MNGSTTPGAEAPARELRIADRVAVGPGVVAGLVAAAQSGIGLVAYIPFAGVGALLAIRRPRPRSAGSCVVGSGRECDRGRRSGTPAAASAGMLRMEIRLFGGESSRETAALRSTLAGALSHAGIVAGLLPAIGRS